MECDIWTDEKIRCRICKDFFKDPTTLPCGHNFCKECITNHWDMEIYEEFYSCPECSTSFLMKPEMTTNETLSLIGKKLQKMNLQGSVEDNMEKKKPSPPIRGKMKAKEKLRQILCGSHEKLLNFYCRDEGTCICEDCRLSAHRGHDTVPAKEERLERELKLDEFLLKAKPEIRKRELNLKKIQNNSEYIKASSKRAVEANERAFTELIASLEKMKEGLNRTIQEQEKALLNQAHLEETQQRLAIQSIQTIITDLATLPQVKEDILFITKSQAITSPQETHLVTINIDENLSFDFVIMTVEKLKNMLVNGCREAIENIQKTVQNVKLASEKKQKSSPPKPVRRSATDVSGPRPQMYFWQPIKSRQDFLRYVCPLTLNPDTAHPSLIISDNNTKATVSGKQLKIKSSMFKSPMRFDRWEQVLCREPLRGGCFYWEVEWSGKGVFIGIALEDIVKKGEGVECGLGRNVNSWCVQCSHLSYSAWHNNIPTSITANIFSPRIGIYLDHTGSLAFYSVSDKMTLMHTFTSEKFSRPLYPAFGFGLDQELQSWIKLYKLDIIV